MKRDSTPSPLELGRFRVGDAVIALRLIDVPASVERWLDQLLAGFPPNDGNATHVATISTHRHDRNSPRRTLSIDLDGQRIAEGFDAYAVVESLLSALDFIAFDSQPALLHIHAGCVVTTTSHAVLVVGSSGAGKSTLVTRLSSLGWGYATDEVVGINDDCMVTGHRRPIVLKAGGVRVPGVRPTELGDGALENASEAYPRLRLWWRLRAVGGLHPPAGRSAPLLADERARFISPNSVTNPTSSGPWQARHILFCERGPGPPTLQRIGPAEAVTRLLEQAFDADRFGARSYELLGRVAAGATCVLARYDDGGALVPEIEALASSTPAQQTVRTLATVVGTGLRRGDGTRSWRIGDEVLVADIHRGAALAFNGTGAVVWEALDGSLDEADVVRFVAHAFGFDAPAIEHDVAEFLEELRSHRLVD